MRPNSPGVIFLLLQALEKAGRKVEKIGPDLLLSLCHPEDLGE